MTRMYGPAAFRKRDCAWVAEVADIAGRGLDGNTHVSLVSLADRLASNHWGHQTLDAFIDPFHAFFSIANSNEASASDCHGLTTGDVENLLVAQDAPGDPRQFVGQGCCQLVAMQPWRCVQKPCSEAEALPIVGAHQNDFCGLDEQGPEILAPSLGDPTQDGSTARAVLAWHETKPCAEVSPALEGLTGANGSDHGGRDQRADTRNAHEALAVGFFLTDRLNLAGDCFDPLIESYPVFVEIGDQAAHPG